MSLGAAIRWFFKVLREGEPQLSAPAPPPAASSPAAPAAPIPGVVAPPQAATFTPSTEPAVQVLALLQKEGRLIDFLREDIASFSDAEIGQAVRDIHRGCRKVLDERITLEPVLKESEGATLTIAPGFDASTVTLTGNVSGAGPWRGTVRHRGWRVAAISLPTIPPKADARIAAPAEVEVG